VDFAEEILVLLLDLDEEVVFRLEGLVGEILIDSAYMSINTKGNTAGT
jgi:hypothetical protein